VNNMNVATSRFGAIDIEPEDVISVPDGILGFPTSTQYVVIEHRPGSVFRWLQSIDEPTVAFLVADPASLVSDFALELDSQTASSLQLDEETPCLVYTIATIPKGKPEETTINLAGPIVVNVANRTARQLVLEDPAYAIRHPVMLGDRKQPAEAAA